MSLRTDKGLALSLLLSAFFLAPGIWFFGLYLGDFNRYVRLASRGNSTAAVIAVRGIVAGDYLELRDSTGPSDRHAFDVTPASGRPPALCRVGVSKSLYEAREIGDTISVTHLEDAFERCVLTSTLPVSRALSIFVLLASGLAVLLGFAILAFTYFSFRKPTRGRPVKLTARFSEETRPDCPSCGTEMVEGYLPTTGGLVWRELEEPVGLPTVFGGLPGTVFWLRRPKLHAFRCESCQILTLKYGRSGDGERG